MLTSSIFFTIHHRQDQPSSLPSSAPRSAQPKTFPDRIIKVSSTLPFCRVMLGAFLSGGSSSSEFRGKHCNDKFAWLSLTAANHITHTVELATVSNAEKIKRAQLTPSPFDDEFTFLLSNCCTSQGNAKMLYFFCWLWIILFPAHCPSVNGAQAGDEWYLYIHDPYCILWFLRIPSRLSTSFDLTRIKATTCLTWQSLRFSSEVVAVDLL